MPFDHLRRREFVAGLGASAAWPLAARAQQPAIPVIGYLDSNAPGPKAPTLEALRAGLAEAGYVEGRNLAIEYRWAAFNFRRLPELAADLVQRQVAAIVTYGARAPILAAKVATSAIPIVFVYAGDPVTDGLITSLGRPGGNLTGVTTFSRDVAGKRLNLLLEIVPQATTVGFLSGTAAFISYEQQTSQMFTAARSLGLQLTVVECRSDRDFEAAFATLVELRAEALILGTFPFSNLNKVVELASRHKIPAMYPYRSLALAGGLMSYEADLVSIFRQVGLHHVGRILKGEKPADLPAQLPTKHDLVINKKTATALGLTIPRILLAAADEVIE
jgi:putative tryptophan/tyrosine transport system substrate-binding protein